MTQGIRDFTTFMLLFLFASILPAEAGDNDNGWHKNKDKDGVQVYTREVEGSKFKEFKAVSVYENTTLTRLVAAITDMDHLGDWLASARETRLLERQQPGKQITYYVYKVPTFLLKDRDIIITQDVSQDPETGKVTIRLSSLPDFIDENDKYVRVKHLIGQWTLTPQPSGKIKLTYQIHSEPEGNLPPFMVNMILTGNPYKSLRQLHDMMPLKQYADTDLAYVKNWPHRLSQQ